MKEGERIKASIKEQRISQYKPTLLDKLKDYVIRGGESEFEDVPPTLNGEILLERHIHQGKVTGFVTAHPDDLAAILPDIKNDSGDMMGWEKWRNKFLAEKDIDIIAGVNDPDPDDYEPDI